MSQYLDGHRVLRKNVAMAKPMQQNNFSGIAWLETSLACQAKSSISPFRLALHIPRRRSLVASPFRNNADYVL
jgi:hypothetical protein